MLKRWIIGLLILTGAAAALAQDYAFRVPEADVTVRIQKDGSAVLHYKITFACEPGAHAIDIVDIGMPTEKHKPLAAAINGADLPESSILKSTYIDNGYETHLESSAIPPGGTGVFEFAGRSDDMVWQDTTDPAMASFRFTPTWFDPKCVRGQTKLSVRLVLPAGEYAQPDKQILWHKGLPPFQFKGIVKGDGGPSVAWVQTVSLNGPNMFGVSFPKAYVDKVQHITIWGLFYKWFSGNPDVQIGSGALLLILFGIAFMMITRATGCLLLVIGCAAMLFGMMKSPAVHLIFYPTVLVFLGIAVWMRLLQRGHYVPASISRDGGAVCSGLTPIEAAILLDMPANRVLTMLIFELTRRGLLEIVTPDPLTVRVIGSERLSGMWRLPDDRMMSIRSYESAFLSSIGAQAELPVEQMDLEKPFQSLVESIRKRMAGYDVELTRDHCRTMVNLMWQKVEKEKDFEVRTRVADQNMTWLMMDRHYEDRYERWQTGGYYYRPHWWYRPRLTPSVGAAVPPAQSAASNVAFQDVVNSLSGRFDKMFDSMKTLRVTETRGIDLTIVDKFTTDVVEALGSSSSGGQHGGGGGGCACACAGCACACACAGGGR